jgi:hypothetical protein
MGHICSRKPNKSDMKKKEYLSPRCQAHCFAAESIICLSGGLNAILSGTYTGFGSEHDMGSSYSGSGGYNGFGEEYEM